MTDKQNRRLTARIEWAGGVMLDVEADIASDGKLDYRRGLWIEKEPPTNLMSFRTNYLNILKQVMDNAGHYQAVKTSYEDGSE